MKLHRDVLIQAIIKYQKVFFSLLDYIDQHDGSLEVPESLYIRSYNDIICADEDDNIQHHLSIDSLSDNGVFIHNKGAGIIIVERVIIDLLRFIDVKRAKELTHSHFESMRAQVVQVVEALEQHAIGSQTFKDEINNFNNLMSEVHSKIKENVITLTAQVESIALKYKEYDSGDSELGATTLYDMISELYNRFVLPCYEFINPDMDMIQTQSFSTAVQGLIDYFSDESGDIALANKVQLRKTAITSYYKDIGDLAEKLVRFSTRLEADRNTYLAIESAFSQLMESVEVLRHGKRKNIYLNANSDVFKLHTALDGLTNQKSKYSAKLNWNREKTPIRFREYMTLIKDKVPESPKNKEVKRIAPKERPNLKKQIKISKIIITTKLPSHINDIHLYLDELISEQVSDYSLADVLYGLEVFLPKYKKYTYRIMPNNRKRMTDEVYFLDYIGLQYSREQQHG